jgi:ankyrin repeat protein
MAVNGGFYDIVRYLVENGANVHGDNNGALHMAIDRGHLDIVKYLVDNGADIDNWARYIANYYNNADIIRYLDTYLPL